MITKPPKISILDNPSLFTKLLKTSEIFDFVKKQNYDYPYWDKFKHLAIPKGVTKEEAWAVMKLQRFTNNEQSPIKTEDGGRFTLSINKKMTQKLSYIDSHASGMISMTWRPNMAQQNQLIISGVMEEAIASSQIEGANTSRKVAKEMILSKRKPKTVSEQMIINNFEVMQKIQDYKDLNLSEDMLIEIQKIITKDTLDEKESEGRFRTDEDNIVVSDKLTGEVVFVPPTAKFMQPELKELISYANDNDGEFVHPVIKAQIIHFWIGYLHPFCDGNGRTARTILFWYLMKNKYWLFQFLAVSRVIKDSKKAYDNSFLHSEYDNNDLNYSLLFMLDAVSKSIDEFMLYFQKKAQDEQDISIISRRLERLNTRQIQLLISINNNPNLPISISRHQLKHGLAYETARRDLMGLVSEGYLTAITKSKKFVYIPRVDFIAKILKK